DSRIRAAVREVRAAEEMHRRRRRKRDLRRRAGDAAEKLEFVERHRPAAPELVRRKGRGERDLPALIVAELEHRGFDDEALDPFDETAPVRTAPEFPVGHDPKTNVFLHLDGVADALVLDLLKGLIVDLF